MQVGFFEIAETYARLDQAGDPLLKLESFVNWENFRPILKKITPEKGAQGGRPALDSILILKCFILQSLYNLSDDAMEYQINDRLSFKRFLGLDPAQKSPDAKTFWLYRERLKGRQLDGAIFSLFSEELARFGYAAKSGQMVDATFVPTHKPTSKHKKQFKQEIPLTDAQVRQVDKDATFTKKNNEVNHGYKNHVEADNEYKLIRKYKVTTAKVHDSQVFEEILDEKNTEKEVWADSAYRSQKHEEMLNNQGFKSCIIEKGYRGQPLTTEQKANNKLKSKVRARIEHVFGSMCNSMNGLTIHTLGLMRAKIKMTFKNLAYNMQRFVFLQTQRLKMLEKEQKIQQLAG